MAAVASSKSLADYQVGQEIGKGATGSVYLATHKATKETCVLKKVRLAHLTQWQRASTLQEMEMMSTLRHPFIVPYIDSWVQDGHTVNLIIGHCEKGDLGSAVAARRQHTKFWPEEQLALWLAQLLLALHHLQAKSILHRDLKSGNIFLTAAGDVQLGDFGLATFRETGDDARHDQALVGTPHFMSPELLSQEGYSFKSDVWSLGCVFYELTALRAPFNAFDIKGLVSKIRRTSAAPLPRMYSADWQGLIKAMLRKDPEHRPSVEELLDCGALRGAVARARERAALLMPDVPLPPLGPELGLSVLLGKAAASSAAAAAGGGGGRVSADGNTPPATPPRPFVLSPGAGDQTDELDSGAAAAVVSKITGASGAGSELQAQRTRGSSSSDGSSAKRDGRAWTLRVRRNSAFVSAAASQPDAAMRRDTDGALAAAAASQEDYADDDDAYLAQLLQGVSGADGTDRDATAAASASVAEASAAAPSMPKPSAKPGKLAAGGAKKPSGAAAAAAAAAARAGLAAAATKGGGAPATKASTAAAARPVSAPSAQSKPQMPGAKSPDELAAVASNPQLADGSKQQQQQTSSACGFLNRSVQRPRTAGAAAAGGGSSGRQAVWRPGGGNTPRGSATPPPPRATAAALGRVRRSTDGGAAAPVVGQAPEARQGADAAAAATSAPQAVASFRHAAAAAAAVDTAAEAQEEEAALPKSPFADLGQDIFSAAYAAAGAESSPLSAMSFGMLGGGVGGAAQQAAAEPDLSVPTPDSRAAIAGACAVTAGGGGGHDSVVWRRNGDFLGSPLSASSAPDSPLSSVAAVSNELMDAAAAASGAFSFSQLVLAPEQQVCAPSSGAAAQTVAAAAPPPAAAAVPPAAPSPLLFVRPPQQAAAPGDQAMESTPVAFPSAQRHQARFLSPQVPAALLQQMQARWKAAEAAPGPAVPFGPVAAAAKASGSVQPGPITLVPAAARGTAFAASLPSPSTPVLFKSFGQAAAVAASSKPAVAAAASAASQEPSTPTFTLAAAAPAHNGTTPVLLAAFRPLPAQQEDSTPVPAGSNHRDSPHTPAHVLASPALGLLQQQQPAQPHPGQGAAVVVAAASATALTYEKELTKTQQHRQLQALLHHLRSPHALPLGRAPAALLSHATAAAGLGATSATPMSTFCTPPDATPHSETSARVGVVSDCAAAGDGSSAAATPTQGMPGRRHSVSLPRTGGGTSFLEQLQSVANSRQNTLSPPSQLQLSPAASASSGNATPQSSKGQDEAEAAAVASGSAAANAATVELLQRVAYLESLILQGAELATSGGWPKLTRLLEAASREITSSVLPLVPPATDGDAEMAAASLARGECGEHADADNVKGV